MPTSPLPPPQAGLQRSESLAACDEALRAYAGHRGKKGTPERQGAGRIPAIGGTPGATGGQAMADGFS